MTNIFLGGFVTPQVRASVGDYYPVIYGTAFKRDDQGRILVDEDPNSATYGMPMASGNPQVIGQCSPDFTMGLNTSFRYRRLSVSATFSWRHGGDIYSGTNGLMDLYGVSKKTEDRTTPFVYPGYKSDGTPNDIVRGGAGDPGAYETLYADVLAISTSRTSTTPRSSSCATSRSNTSSPASAYSTSRSSPSPATCCCGPRCPTSTPSRRRATTT